MSLEPKQVRNVNQRSKDLINGYIRLEYENSNIPIAINHICLIYHLIKDGFGKHGERLKLSSSNSGSTNYDVVETKSGDWKWNTVYGTVDIDTEKFKNMIANWTFKVDFKCGAIGIDSSNSQHTDTFCFGKADDANNYGWHTNGQLFSSSEPHIRDALLFGPKDIIKMELNVAKKMLKFYKNDVDVNLQFNDIDTSKTYRLAVSLYNESFKGKLHIIESEFIP